MKDYKIRTIVIRNMCFLSLLFFCQILNFIITNLNKDDNIAHYGHLTGAICGSIFGFLSMQPEILDNIYY